MRLRTLVLKELWQRPVAMFTSLLAILLGVTALVAIQNITRSSEREVAVQLDQLGANVLVLPQSVSLQDYYSADMHGATMPEEFVTRLALARMVGVQDLAPKLCVPCPTEDRHVVLTGILPKSEFEAKVAWQGADLLAGALNAVGREHEGCRGRTCSTGSGDGDPRSFAKTRVVEHLAKDEALLGADVASARGLSENDQIELMGRRFRVAAVLPPTGTVDDGRVFAHLHTVQQLAGTGPVVNVIEIMGCCEDVAGSLTTELADVLPDAKVVTISQIVDTQVTVNRLMSRLSYAFFAILILIGAASVASVMYFDVTQRRRELGTLMALGATPGFVQRMMMLKAALLGLAGGVAGIGTGTVCAWCLGPWLLDLDVTLFAGPAWIGLATAMTIALSASYLPARRAANLDPCVCFQEV